MSPPGSPSDASTTATELAQRTWDHDPHGDKGDFARLIPLSRTARQAFQEVATMIDNDPDWQPEARRYVDAERTESGEYIGWYRFNMDVVPPDFDTRGWWIGSGHPHRPEVVPILLTSQVHDWGVATRHFRISFRPDGGPPILQARAKLIINGQDELERVAPTWGRRALDERMGIGVGDLQYRFEFTKFGRSESYHQQLREKLKFVADNDNITPSPAPLVVGQWRAYATGFGGATSIVLPGYDTRSSEVVAIKRIKRSSRNSHAVRSEIALLRLLDHPRVCRLIAIVGDEYQTLNSGAFDEINLILTPLTSSFADHKSAPATQLLSFWADCCAAVAYLHSQGIMHRDIKRQNIGIRLRPLQAIIQDLGTAIQSDKSTDHMAGTVPYLAPEVAKFKAPEHQTRRDIAPYNNAVDIWGLGIAFSEALGGVVQWSPRLVSPTAWRDRFSKRPKTDTPEAAFLEKQVGAAAQWEAANRPLADRLKDDAEEFLRQHQLKRKMPQ